MTLVSIVGDFHSSILPIIYEHKDRLTQHILLYKGLSRDTKMAQQLSAGINSFKDKYSYTFTNKEYLLKDDTLEDLYTCAQDLVAQAKDPQELYINITDGLANITTVLTYMLFGQGVRFLSYDMYENTQTLMDTKRYEKSFLQEKMSIVDHFLLKGFEMEQSAIKEFAKENKELITLLIEKHHRHYNQFLGVDPRSVKYIQDLPDKHSLIRDIFCKYGFGKYMLKDPRLTGNIFESYIYNLLRDLDYDDIEIGFKVFATYKNSRIANEFDILIMKNNHLHMIECKYLNRIKLEDLIYKYTALANTLDHDGKMIIVMKKKPLYSKRIDLHENKGLIYKRGILNNIKVFGDVKEDPQAFVQKVKKEFEI